LNPDFPNYEKYFEELSSRILTFIDSYRKEVFSKIYSHGRFIKEDEKYFYTVILKTINSFEGGNIFIRNFDSSREFQIPLYIIIRAILNDIIISEYIIIRSSNDEEQIELINQLNFDHIKHLLSSIKIESKARKWSEEEKQKEIRNIKWEFSKYFKIDGSHNFKPLRTSVDSLVEWIFKNSDDERSHKLIGKAYFLYKDFSKLEHFGELSFPLVHIVYNDSKQHILANELFSSIRIIIAALNNYCHVWEDLEINFDRLKNLEMEILKMVPQQNRN